MDLTPYSTIRPLMGPLESWLGPEDAMRLQAYALYEGIYKNVPQSFKLVQRGSEARPIYLPNARTIIEAKHRFLAKRWNYALVPGMGSDSERAAAKLILDALFRREKLRSKFSSQKRWGMVRGDSVWHIVADADKPAGRRLSVYEADPASFFPIYDPWNAEKILGVHLVDPVVNDGGKTVIKRQTYRKEDNGRISYELSWWESGAWDDREDGATLKKVTGKEVPPGEDNKPVFEELPPLITSIPVYHVRNNHTPGDPYGSSELAGYETLMAAVNQSISDEDLSLALEGLGLYATNSGPPVDEDDEETNWKLGPGWVVEIDEDSTFTRVNGVSSVAPFLDHINKIEGSMREAAGVPDIAVGKVDTAIAESGISLAFQMGPLLSGNEEKEEELLAVADHMLFDLVTMWLPAYEAFTTAARAVSTVDDPMPVNRAAVIAEVVALLSTEPPLMSAEYARTYLSEKLGYEFPETMAEAIVTEAAAYAEARNTDPFQSRVAEELEQGGDQ